LAAEIQITDKHGWRKTFVLDKNIVHLGAAAANDIVLESWRGSGVAPRHVQLIRLAHDAGAAYRLVNLGDAELSVSGENERTVAPHSLEDLSTGDRLRLGDFTLVFQFQGAGPVGQAVAQAAAGTSAAPYVDKLTPAGAGSGPAPGASIPRETSRVRRQDLNSPDGWADHASDIIGLTLTLQQTELAPDRPLQGTLTIRNLGQRTGVQFQMELDGLDPDCYILGPGPILFPNAERDMQLVLHHPRRLSPPAGERRIAVRATAPDVYPGESAVVSATVDIEPFYDQRLRVVESE